MSECNGRCDWYYAANRLEDRVRELKEELSEARKETSDYNSIKRERDELKAAFARSYDSYMTDPERTRS